MYALSAFITSSAFQNNVPGQTSAICELSKLATSFTREMGVYGSDTYPSVRLVSFSSKDEDDVVEVPSDFTSLILGLSQWLTTRSLGGFLSDDEENCRLQIVAEFGTSLTITGIGVMVNSGAYWMPSSLTISSLTGGDNTLRIWFSDSHFRAQYDGYEILVVQPIDNLDDFHLSPAVIIPVIRGIRVPDITERVRVVAGDKPYTLLWSRDYDWVDKNDPENKHPTPWSVVIYGNAGINEDLIKLALQEHILANSTYTREEWEVIFPEIFLPTEYYLCPFWHQLAIPEGITLSGLYSPVMKHSDQMAYALLSMPGYDEPHLIEYLCASTSVYQSIGFVTCGHPRNRNGIKDFATLWPDYANISTTNLDFNRLSPSTQNFISLLIRMFHAAESMDEYSDIPDGMTRIERGGIWYLSSSFEKVQYLVPWKSNVLVP